MRKIIRLMVLMFVISFVFGVSNNTSAKKHEKGVLVLGKVIEHEGLNPVLKENPKAIYTFMPLTVGNQWQYNYQVHFITNQNVPESRRPSSVYATEWYQEAEDPFFEKSPDGHSAYTKLYFYDYDQTNWTETYTITSVSDGKYFFSAKSDSERGDVRDGRYKNSVEKNGRYWQWLHEDLEFSNDQLKSKGIKSIYDPIELNGINHVLVEAIIRPQAIKDPKPEQIAYDFRNYINWFLTEDDQISNKASIKFYGDGHELDQDMGDFTVTVPAGTFKHCIKITESFAGVENNGHKVKWTNYMFFAPGVGRVFEYQQLPSGTLTYETALTKLSG